MRIIIGLFAGILGMLVGWAGLAFLVISLAEEDHDGGVAMGAFFQIGPVGGIIGFIVGVWLFVKFGIVRKTASQRDSKQLDATSPPVKTRISKPFAIVVVLVVAALSYQGWYMFIRSPYLTHGFMTLDMQFSFPQGTVLPTDVNDEHIDVTEGNNNAFVTLRDGQSSGDHPEILASAIISYKTRSRLVRLEIPGVPAQVWQLDLGNDPDPTPGYSPFKLPSGSTPIGIEMSYRLSADH